MKSKIKEYFRQCLHDRAALCALLCNGAFWLFALLYLELLTHYVAFGVPSLQFVYGIGFTIPFASALTLLTSLLPKKVHFPLTALLVLLCILLYGSQMVYFFIFGTFYSVGQMQMGGAALTSFWKEALLTMRNYVAPIFALFVPLAALLLLRWRRPAVFRPSNFLWRAGLLAILIAVHFLTILCLPIGGTGFFTSYDFYYSDTTSTDQAAQRFGLLTAFRLDLFHVEAASDQAGNYYTPEPAAEETTAPEENSPVPTEETQPPTEETQPPIEYNILEFDFDELSGLTDDETIIAINDYCNSLTGTNKNAYTGMLTDYNLIVMCAESFSTAAVDPELTPTLYRLSQEGIVFNNYYNTFPNTTTDGEYTLCMGLYPDTTRGKSASSFYASRNSYLPFCLGNIFQQQKGIQSYGYHNYYASYYGRGLTHPNMGYTMKFAGDGMSFTVNWPSSDLEMMEQSVDDYIGQEQFHAYYMTFSGHLSYDTSNPMASRNWEEVQDLPYSYAARCYLSCNLELEKAVTYLMERLEEAGVAEKTAIVIAGDHFPYGLTVEQYSELVDYEVDDFSRAKSTLIFWVGGLEEPIVVDEYCCNADILPTILNLWGFDYDSRMLTGTDVFSDGTHVAILSDKSFLTDKVWVNASTGETRYLVDESELPADYVDSMIKLVKTKFSLSADILNTAYYNFIFGQGSVSIDRYSW